MPVPMPAADGPRAGNVERRYGPSQLSCERGPQLAYLMA